MRASTKSIKPLDKRFALIGAEQRFKRACEQIVLLNGKIRDMQRRYNKAKRDNLRSFRYNMRLQLAVVEGLRNTYYDYAHNKADQVAQLRQELFGEEVEVISDSDTDYMSE